jgi:hypothetical protein
MSWMKYLVFIDEDNVERIFIFPETIKHSKFSEQLHEIGLTPIRGGFVQYRNGKLSCHGEAVSLDLQADKEKDLALLMKQIGGEKYKP